MANVPISSLPSVTSSLAADYVPVVQTGVTGKATVAQLLAVGVFSGNVAITGPSPWIDVTAAKYGAIGDDTADDTVALNAAWADMPTYGGTLFFPPGKTFKITSQLNWVGKTGTILAYGATIDFWGTLPTGITVTNATNATPIVVTATTHGRVVGDMIFVSGVAGNTSANGWWAVSAVADANTLTLQGSVGNGAYTSGGTLYPMSAAILLGYAAGLGGNSTVTKGWRVLGLRVRWNNGGGTNYFQNATVGIQWQNIVTGTMWDVGVQGFGIGIECRGDGVGCATSVHKLATMDDNGIQVHLYANNTSGTNGYVTEQHFHGGDFYYSGAQTTWANQVWEVKAETGALNGGAVSVASNAFFHSSFQGNSGGANVAPRFDLLSGTQYLFDGCRFETTTHVVMPMVFASSVSFSQVNGTSGSGQNGDLQIQDNSSSGSSNPGLVNGMYWQRLFVATTNKSTANTSAETSFAPSGSGSLTLPAYFFSRSRTVQVKGHGLYSTLGASPGNLTIKFKLGSITWQSGNVALPVSASSWWWEMEAELTHRVFGVGAAGRVVGWVKVFLQQAAAAAGTSPLFLPIALTSTAIDDSASQLIDSSFTFSVADAANIWNCEMYRVYGAP